MSSILCGHDGSRRLGLIVHLDQFEFPTHHVQRGLYRVGCDLWEMIHSG